MWISSVGLYMDRMYLTPEELLHGIEREVETLVI